MIRIAYASGAAPLSVNVIASWDRGSITPCSGGSGLKDYFKNQVWSLFESAPHIDRIVMVRAGGPPFAIYRTHGKWYDVTGEPVVLTSADRASTEGFL